MTNRSMFLSRRVMPWVFGLSYLRLDSLRH